MSEILQKFAATGFFITGAWAWLGENSAQIGAVCALLGLACMTWERLARARREHKDSKHLHDVLNEIQEERRSGTDRRKSRTPPDCDRRKHD